MVQEVHSVPERFALGSLRDGRLRVVESIEVAQMMEGGKYVVEATDLNEFGFGDNLSEAIADLQAAIAELYLPWRLIRSGLDQTWQRFGAYSLERSARPMPLAAHEFDSQLRRAISCEFGSGLVCRDLRSKGILGG